MVIVFPNTADETIIRLKDILRCRVKRIEERSQAHVIGLAIIDFRHSP